MPVYVRISNEFYQFYGYCNLFKKLQNPVWLEDTLTRLDYFMTSLSTHTDLYKFTESIDAEINTKSERLQLTAHLNGKNITVPNLPLWFNCHIDAKYDRPEQMAFNFGLARKFCV